MEIIRSEELTEEQKLRVTELWNGEYPKVLSLESVKAFDVYMQDLTGKAHIVIQDAAGKIQGWLICFNRDNERCFAMIMDPSLQGKGWGSKLLYTAKEYNSELVGWVIDNDTGLKENGEYYKSPIEFYRKNGFTILDDEKFTKNGIRGIKVKWSRSEHK